MAPPAELTPIIVGAGDYTHRDAKQLLTPLDAIAIAADRALEAAAGTDRDLLARVIDCVVVVQINAFEYDEGNERLPSRLADRIGATPRKCEYTKVGGENPQVGDAGRAGVRGMRANAHSDSVDTVRLRMHDTYGDTPLAGLAARAPMSVDVPARGQQGVPRPGDRRAQGGAHRGRRDGGVRAHPEAGEQQARPRPAH